MDRASRTLLGAMACTLFVLIITLLLTSCGQGGGPVPESLSHTVRESAGVAIIESTEPACPEGEGWRLSHRPFLTVCVMEGPEEYTFFRALSAKRFRDGRILVVNTGI